MSVDTKSISLISFELASINVTFGMPEGTFSLSFVANPLTFVDSTIDPFLNTISAPHFTTTRSLAIVLVNEHLTFVHGSIWEHIVIHKYQALNIIFEFWKQIIISLFESVVLIDCEG
jgi:hypothetical protein